MSKIKNIITDEEGVPVLENRLGCRLIPYREGNHYGLGSFFLDGKRLGGMVTSFAVEETVGKTYKASEYEIVENSPERGIVRFSGVDGKLEFSVNITLLNSSTGYRVDYEFDPIHPIYHPLYVNVPFKSSAMQFVKYPYEDSIVSSFNGRWAVEPDRGRVPFLYGCEYTEGETSFIGVGYELTQDFTRGRFEYDPNAFPDCPFKIYAPFWGMARPLNLQCVTRLELLCADLDEEYRRAKRGFSFIISTAKGKYECVKGYIDQSGYDPSVPICRSIDDSVAALMSLYRSTSGYVKGKGYHLLIRFDTGDYDTTIPHGWYSKYILTGPQIQLAYQLYRYWEDHKDESWARERAMEMAGFLVEMQEESGAFSNWDTDKGGISVIHPQNNEGTSFREYLYSVCDMSIGALFLSKLYEEMKGFENIDHPEWKNASMRAMDYLIDRMGPDGKLGGHYNREGNYHKETSGLSSALLALHQLYKETRDERYEEARVRLEDWLYNRFVRVDDWCNASRDAGAWQGAGWPPPHNNDNMNILSFATYCANLHKETGNERYLQLAKDAVSYLWLTSVPIQLRGYRHVTKGLQREQDFYSCYDVPFRSNEVIECLPYLSKVTGDPFFMGIYRMMIQTELHYQAIDKNFPGFYIGLKPDETGREPIDELAEERVGYIVRFAAFFLGSVNSPSAYRYVGGEGWGIGLDYNLPFNPSLGLDAPYVLSASTMVRDMSWNPESTMLSILLYDKHGRAGTLEVKWRPESHPILSAMIEIDGKVHKASEFYDYEKKVLSINYKHQQPTKAVKVYCRGVTM